MKLDLCNQNINIGDCFLEDSFKKCKIYFLGAKKLNDDLWSINLSFERIEYKYDDGYTCNANGDNSFGYGYGYASSDTLSIETSIGESLTFANYLGRKITAPIGKISEFSLGKSTSKIINKSNFYKLTSMTILNINKFHIEYTASFESID